MMKFDHIGVTCKTLDEGRALLQQALFVRRWTSVFDDPVNGVSVRFGLDASGMCYELVAPLSDESPISRVLAQKVNVLNHTAYLVEDLPGQAARLSAAGFVPITPPRPAIAYGNKPIQFFVARSHLLVELIEAPGHEHVYADVA